MRGYVIGLVAFDFVLRVCAARAVDMSLVIKIPDVDLNDAAADTTGFGIPLHVIADLETGYHVAS